MLSPSYSKPVTEKRIYIPLVENLDQNIRKVNKIYSFPAKFRGKFCDNGLLARHKPLKTVMGLAYFLCTQFSQVN